MNNMSQISSSVSVILQILVFFTIIFASAVVKHVILHVNQTKLINWIKKLQSIYNFTNFMFAMIIVLMVFSGIMSLFYTIFLNVASQLMLYFKVYENYALIKQLDYLSIYVKAAFAILLGFNYTGEIAILVIESQGKKGRSKFIPTIIAAFRFIGLQLVEMVVNDILKNLKTRIDIISKGISSMLKVGKIGDSTDTTDDKR